MCRRTSGPIKNRSIPMTCPTTGPGSATPTGRGEDLLELVRSRDLELIVLAVGWSFVGAPALKDRGVAEAVPLHVVVLHLADALQTKRLPGQILAGAPPALAARHAGRTRLVQVRPVAPRMVFERPLPQWRELLRQLATPRHRERRRDADVMEPTLSIVESQEE